MRMGGGRKKKGVDRPTRTERRGKFVVSLIFVGFAPRQREGRGKKKGARGLVLREESGSAIVHVDERGCKRKKKKRTSSRWALVKEKKPPLRREREKRERSWGGRRVTLYHFR